MNTDNFTIESSDIELAQNICKMITDADVRNRAAANAVGANIAGKYFDSENYNVDTTSGLHNIGTVLQDIDISDIYLNNAYIDVRVFFNENEIAIPAAHLENNLLPAAYMFIKITQDLAGASVIGFMNPENIDRSKLIDEYIKIGEDELESFYDIEPLLSAYPDDSIEVEDRDIFAYLDNTLDDKNAFYACLLKSKDGRLRLARAVKAQNVFKYVSVNNTEFTESGNINEHELDFASEFNIESEPEELILTETSDTAEDFDRNMSDSSNQEEGSAELAIDDIEELSVDGTAERSNDESTFEDNKISELTEEDLEIDFGFEEAAQSSPTTEDVSEETVQELPAEKDIEDNNGIQTEENALSEGFEYKTVASPSLNSTDVLDELSKEEESGIPENTDSVEASDEEIETLFNNEEIPSVEDTEESSPGLKVYSNSKNGKKSIVKPLLVLTLLIVAAAAGYTGYTKFLASPSAEDKLSLNTSETKQTANNKDGIEEAAMPIESVETSDISDDKDEAVSASIPAIEQNLDASILVSNLKVDWEVPAGYASNTSAKRYLVKLGKIIQLNLKTELLLLSKPPITNKIAVEIVYNPDSRKFEASGITISSGEKSVDDLIIQTVNKALAMNLSMNTDSFAKLQGNPVLIIHL